jgi:hypothetical protein
MIGEQGKQEKKSDGKADQPGDFCGPFLGRRFLIHFFTRTFFGLVILYPG